MSLTVWCVCTFDKYDSGYVYNLKEMVENNLSIPHEFKCITTRKLEGIHTVFPALPYQGWWSKLNLFSRADGPSIYFDLDVLIVDSIDYLADFTDNFSAPANWAQSGHGGIQSSVMCWPGSWTYPLEHLQWPQARSKYWGDQEYLWDLLGEDWQRIPGIGSYKYHVRPAQQIPEGLSTIVFHGKPDPHEVDDPCISSFTATLRNHIKSSTDSGSKRAFDATA